MSPTLLEQMTEAELDRAWINFPEHRSAVAVEIRRRNNG